MWRCRTGRGAAGRSRLDVVGDTIAVDDNAVAGRLGPRLEGFIDDGLVAGTGELPTGGVDAHEADAGRDAEGRRRLVLERPGHEVAGDRRRIVRPLLPLA